MRLGSARSFTEPRSSLPGLTDSDGSRDGAKEFPNQLRIPASCSFRGLFIEQRSDREEATSKRYFNLFIYKGREFVLNALMEINKVITFS